MEKIGILKEFDKLGRIVIPKELRVRFGFSDEVEIVPTKEGVLLKSPEYVLVRKERESSKEEQNGPRPSNVGGILLR